MKFAPCLLLFCCLPALASIEDDIADAAQAHRKRDQAGLERAAQALRHTPLAIYADYYQLSLNLQQADKETIQQFLNRREQTPLMDQLRVEWLALLGKGQQWELFNREYSQISKPDAELNCYRLQARWQQGEKSALDEARRLWFNGKAQPNSCGPIFNSAYDAGVISDYDVLQRIRLALENNNVSLALALNEKLASPLVLPEKNLKQAEKSVDKFLKSASESQLNTVGKRAVALFALQRLIKESPDLAYERWQRIQHHFPSNEQQYFLLLLGHEAARKHDRRALGWFNQAGTRLANAEQLAWWVRAALRKQNWDEVLKVINAMRADQQKEDAWRYWKARALQQQGNKAESNRLLAELSNEHHFYGLLANEELADQPALTKPTQVYKATESDIDTLQRHPAVQRTLALYKAGLRREATKEWAWLMRSLEDKQMIAAAEITRRHHMYDRSIGAASQTVNIHDFSLRYPTPYRHILTRHVQANQLDEAWVYGLMRQESRFIVAAQSNVGARGLMQVMPDTGRWVARKIGISNFNVSMLNDMDINVQLGTYYMKHVSEQFNDNPVLASAAYNAGPGRAKRWRDDSSMEGAIYAESIPFLETRDYVKKVLANSMYYAEQMKLPFRSLKQRLGLIRSNN